MSPPPVQIDLSLPFTPEILGPFTFLPGAELADHEATTAFFLTPPFSRWQANRRERPASTP